MVSALCIYFEILVNVMRHLLPTLVNTNDGTLENTHVASSYISSRKLKTVQPNTCRSEMGKQFQIIVIHMYRYILHSVDIVSQPRLCQVVSTVLVSLDAPNEGTVCASVITWWWWVDAVSLDSSN